jgi:cytoplasmic iron level regulating protein YaaA (DUF328/UPF0246 family)
MRHQQEANEGYRLPVNCFKCSEGCIHLEYGNILFTFTPKQFQAVAEVMGKVYRELEAENLEREEQGVMDYAEALVM